MKTKFPAKGALDLVEESVFLLRTVPAWLTGAYLIGTMPFVLAFLYFWTDMSKSPFAHRHVIESGFALSIAYLWMKFWQSIFASRLREFIAGQPFERYTARRLFRILLHQGILQPYGIIVLPLAMLAFIPFPSLYAFYHNISLYGDGSMPEVKEVRKRAWSVGNLWMGQNHALVALLSLVALVIFGNVFAFLLTAPELLRMLFGVETVFTLSAAYMLNTTFLAVVCGISYLLIGLLSKTVYVLRAFYGESLQTGADLIADLKMATPVY